MIPCASPVEQYQAHRAAIDAAVARVLAAGQYVLGDEVRAFETEFAACVGARNGVGVASGTDAITLALRAAGVGNGDDVITVSHTAVATVAAIEQAGATPVFADVDAATMTLDPRALTRVRTPRTRAVVAVHLYGHPCDLDPIAEFCSGNDLILVEDCAQAHGATYRGRRVGSFGRLACFSFYPTKNLGALGDGGLVATSDGDLADRLRRLREYGWRERNRSEEPGVNSRLDELQAAVLRAKLPLLDADNALRRRWARVYDESLADGAVRTPVVRPWASHAYHLYVVRTPHRDALREHLAKRGVQAGVHYPLPVHLQPAYRRLASAPLPETEAAAREVLSLPMFPELGPARAAAVAEAVRAFRMVPA